MSENDFEQRHFIPGPPPRFGFGDEFDEGLEPPTPEPGQIISLAQIVGRVRHYTISTDLTQPRRRELLLSLHTTTSNLLRFSAFRPQLEPLPELDISFAVREGLADPAETERQLKTALHDHTTRAHWEISTSPEPKNLKIFILLNLAQAGQLSLPPEVQPYLKNPEVVRLVTTLPPSKIETLIGGRPSKVSREFEAAASLYLALTSLAQTFWR